MPNTAFNLNAELVSALLTLGAYLLIVLIFFHARRKYRGGIVALAIRYIIAALALFSLADLALFFIPRFGFQPAYPLHIVFKVGALACLAAAGLKLHTR